ncbi:hypothetical protein J437_LFUL009634, partial [Ladona fulva]
MEEQVVGSQVASGPPVSVAKHRPWEESDGAGGVGEVTLNSGRSAPILSPISDPASPVAAPGEVSEHHQAILLSRPSLAEILDTAFSSTIDDASNTSCHSRISTTDSALGTDDGAISNTGLAAMVDMDFEPLFAESDPEDVDVVSLRRDQSIDMMDSRLPPIPPLSTAVTSTPSRRTVDVGVSVVPHSGRIDMGVSLSPGVGIGVGLDIVNLSTVQSETSVAASNTASGNVTRNQIPSAGNSTGSTSVNVGVNVGIDSPPPEFLSHYVHHWPLEVDEMSAEVGPNQSSPEYCRLLNDYVKQDRNGPQMPASERAGESKKCEVGASGNCEDARKRALTCPESPDNPKAVRKFRRRTSWGETFDRVMSSGQAVAAGNSQSEPPITVDASTNTKEECFLVPSSTAGEETSATANQNKETSSSFISSTDPSSVAESQDLADVVVEGEVMKSNWNCSGRSSRQGVRGTRERHAPRDGPLAPDLQLDCFSTSSSSSSSNSPSLHRPRLNNSTTRDRNHWHWKRRAGASSSGSRSVGASSSSKNPRNDPAPEADDDDSVIEIIRVQNQKPVPVVDLTQESDDDDSISVEPPQQPVTSSTEQTPPASSSSSSQNPLRGPWIQIEVPPTRRVHAPRIEPEDFAGSSSSMRPSHPLPTSAALPASMERQSSSIRPQGENAPASLDLRCHWTASTTPASASSSFSSRPSVREHVNLHHGHNRGRGTCAYLVPVHSIQTTPVQQPSVFPPPATTATPSVNPLPSSTSFPYYANPPTMASGCSIPVPPPHHVHSHHGHHHLHHHHFAGQPRHRAGVGLGLHSRNYMEGRQSIVLGRINPMHERLWYVQQRMLERQRRRLDQQRTAIG